MQNGHIEDKHSINFYEKFATKTEVHLLESQVRELIKDYAGMAVVIQNLDNTVKEVNKTLKILIENKGVSDKIKLFSFKCMIWFGSITSTLTIPILVAHSTGLIKMFGKYMMS